MGSRPRFVEFVHLPTYVRNTKGVLDDDDQREVELTLCSDPRAGAVIPGTGGVRKLRIALARRGKSGGARVVYFYRPASARVYLLMFYPKNVLADLTSAQRQQMRRLTALLRTEG